MIFMFIVIDWSDLVGIDCNAVISIVKILAFQFERERERRARGGSKAEDMLNW